MKAGWRVRRLTDGSAIVAHRLGRGFVPLSQDGEVRLVAAVVRCAAGVWAGYGLLEVAHQSPLVMAGATGVWCLAAWRAEPETAQQEQQVTDATAEPAAPTHTDAEIYEGLVDYLRRLIADRNGVHLTEALRGLQEQGLLAADLTAAEFGRQLQRRGIPVRASLKVAGSVGPGVHRDDLPAASEPLPETTFVAAG